MKRNFDRRTAAEKFNLLPSPPPGSGPTPSRLAPLGLSHLLKLGTLSACGGGPTVTMKELGDHFLATRSGPNYGCKVTSIVTELGPTALVERLTVPQLRSWVNGQPRARSTANHYLEILAMMIKAGLQDGLLQSNPLGGGVKRQLTFNLPSTDADILTVDEVARVMEEARKRPEACHVLALMFFGGLEISQACGLYYDNISTEIRVPAHLTLNAQKWELYCPTNLPAWLNSDGPKKGRITHLSGNSMGRVIKKIFWKLGIPRPASLDYTWAA